MSPHFPAVTSEQVVRVLHNGGFSLARQTGSSHAIWWRESDKRRVTVPIHAGKILKRKTLAQLLQDAGLTTEEFQTLLGQR